MESISVWDNIIFYILAAVFLFSSIFFFIGGRIEQREILAAVLQNVHLTSQTNYSFEPKEEESPLPGANENFHEEQPEIQKEKLDYKDRSQENVNLNVNQKESTDTSDQSPFKRPVEQQIHHSHKLEETLIGNATEESAPTVEETVSRFQKPNVNGTSSIHSQQESPITAQNPHKCESCGTENRNHANFCVGCGTNLHVEQQPVKNDASTTPCKQCGQYNISRSNFCKECGSSLHSEV
nr:zinc ribbon domain-containing protein [Salirhabdus salicampi]